MECLIATYKVFLVEGDKPRQVAGHHLNLRHRCELLHSTLLKGLLSLAVRRQLVQEQLVVLDVVEGVSVFLIKV